MDPFYLIIGWIIIANPVKAETRTCDGECGCVEPEPCTLRCMALEICKTEKLTCKDGYPCTIICDQKEACLEADIRINGATSFNLTCSGEIACKAIDLDCAGVSACNIACNGVTTCESMLLDCGTSHCALQCSDTDTCKSLEATTDSAKSFECVDVCSGNGMSIPPPTLRTTSQPTEDPETPTKSPTLNPTHRPSPNPTERPSVSPTLPPTLYPTRKPTTPPITKGPTSNTNAPSASPTNEIKSSSMTPTKSPQASSTTMNPPVEPTESPDATLSVISTTNPSHDSTLSPSQITRTEVSSVPPTKAPCIDEREVVLRSTAGEETESKEDITNVDDTITIWDNYWQYMAIGSAVCCCLLIVSMIRLVSSTKKKKDEDMLSKEVHAPHHVLTEPQSPSTAINTEPDANTNVCGGGGLFTEHLASTAVAGNMVMDDIVADMQTPGGLSEEDDKQSDMEEIVEGGNEDSDEDVIQDIDSMVITSGQ